MKMVVNFTGEASEKNYDVCNREKVVQNLLKLVGGGKEEAATNVTIRLREE